MALASDTAARSPITLAALVSGGGTTVQNLADYINTGRLNARLALIIASNDKARQSISERNLHQPIPIQCIRPKDFSTPAAFSKQVFAAISQYEASLVCLAGFLCLLTIPDNFARKVINIHPALLPDFGGKGMFGRHVHEAVLAAGCKETGCTVHYADATYDTGPIILQRKCPVLPHDTPQTLAARVFEQECIAYPQAIKKITQQHIIR